jgi:hypothetical protein
LAALFADPDAWCETTMTEPAELEAAPWSASESLARA